MSARPEASRALSPAAGRPAGGRAGLLPAWRVMLSLGGAYLALALLSIALSRQPGQIAGVWYANAVAVVALLRSPRRQWPALLAVVMGANAAANAAWGDPLGLVLAFLPANVLEIVLAAALLQRAGLADSGLRTPRQLLRLLLLGAALPQAMAALLAAVTFVALGLGPFAQVVQTWFQGGAVGALAALPLLLLLANQPPAVLRPAVADARLWTLLPLAVAVTLLCMAHVPFPFVYIGVPLLVAAMLLDLVAVALLVLVTSVTAMLALATGVLVPPPVTAEWQHGFVYMAHAAALAPSLLLSAAAADLRDSHRRLVERKQALLQANEALQYFVRVASHDLREPLNTIAQFTGLVARDQAAVLPPDASQYLALVQREALRMRHLLDDVLQYSQVQRTDLPPPRAVALDAVAAQVRGALSARLHGSGARLDIAPLPVVLGHASLLSLLLQNLLDNAVKFVAPGQVPEVTVSARLGEAGGQPVTWLTVADHGIGIAAEDQARLFRPFQRLHLRRDYEGTGLGLALCRQIAQMHGGEVTVESTPGEGARFTVRLPLAPAA